MTTTPKPGSAQVQADHRIFHKYLRDRYAQSVVLTFGQIEDLLGSTLPAAARVESAWWTDTTGGTAMSPAWVQAERTALPNLPAGIVRFDRQ
jgi:hypothetical protein